MQIYFHCMLFVTCTIRVGIKVTYLANPLLSDTVERNYLITLAQLKNICKNFSIKQE